MKSAACSLLFDLAIAGDRADAGDGDADDRLGNATVGRSSEEQFVILAAVQGKLERVVAANSWKSGSFDNRSNMTFVANVAQIGGQAVAGVDHGARKFVLAEVAAEIDAGVGIEMTWMRSRAELVSGAKFLESGNRSTEHTAHINDVTWACARAKHSFAFRYAAYNNDVGEDPVRRLRRVAAGEDQGIPLRELQESADELIDPALRKIGRKREGEKCRVGDSSHGGDVAEAAGEATVSDGVGRVPPTAEVNAFEREVCCNKHFMPAWDVQDGAVVTHAVAGFAQVGAQMTGANLGHLAAWLRQATNTADEFEFGQRHNSSFKFRVGSFKLELLVAGSVVPRFGKSKFFDFALARNNRRVLRSG